MKKAALLLAPGFEEIEALTVVDVLRRADIQCDTFSTSTLLVEGSHRITVQADKLLDDTVKDYDMLILPGGLPGSTNLRDDERVITLVQFFNATPGKFIAAICAAPIVLEKAGIIKGRRLTSYPSANHTALFKEADYTEDLVAIDGNMITSRGPATTLLFSYTLIEVLGKDSSGLKQGMLYNLLKERSFQ